MDAIFIFLILLAFYIPVLLLIHRDERFKSRGITVWGPFIMWRTRKGLKAIDWLSRPKRWWLAYAAVSKVICATAMVSMVLLLLWEATIVPSIPADQAPAPELILGIPGINPIIPIGYGILGLIVAIVVHEFAHGILARVNGMRLKALGLLVAMIPLGAFAEPDEDELTKANKRQRSGVYAVGPGSNIILATAFVLLFTMGMVATAVPMSHAPVMVSSLGGGPADMADLNFGDQILAIDGMTMDCLEDFDSVLAPLPGNTVTVEYSRSGQLWNATVFSGVVVTSVSSGMPAEEAGVESDMMIHSINDTIVRNNDALTNALKATVPGETVELTMLKYDEVSGTYNQVPYIDNITLTSRKNYLSSIDPSLIGPDFEDYGMMGINSAYLGAGVTTPDLIQQTLAHPFAGADSFADYAIGTLRYIALPFSGLAPVPNEIGQLFVPGGIFTGMDTGTFWMLANCCYWIFWINLMVGLTNALPAVPLDGGFLFNDWMDSLVARLRKGASKESRDRIVGQLTTFMAFAILFLILWQIIGPRLN